MRTVFPSLLLPSLLFPSLLSVCVLLGTGCGVQRYLPGKAVLSDRQLETYRHATPPQVTYTSPARTDMPVMPLQIFGLFYGLDIVLVSRHDDWDMHEYARVDLPDGPLWLAKDARPTGVQTIIADVDDIDTWVPEATVPRRHGAVTVDDRSSGRDVDLSIAYTNWDGDPVQIEVSGRVQRKPPGKRNGSTMGHSRQSTAVVLDLQRFGPAAKASIQIAGKDVGIEHLLGIYPMKFLLEQAQGGVMVASQLQAPTPNGGYTLTRPGKDPIDPATGQPGWPTSGTEHWTVAEGTELDDTRVIIAQRDGPLITLRYVFIDGGLLRAEAWQIQHEEPVTVMRFSPALPDLSRSFDGTAVSRFELEVNGQAGHGTGSFSATWADADHVDLRLRPDDPWWLADRPMDGQLSFEATEDGPQVQLQMARISVE